MVAVAAVVDSRDRAVECVPVLDLIGSRRPTDMRAWTSQPGMSAIPGQDLRDGATSTSKGMARSQVEYRRRL